MMKRIIMSLFIFLSIAGIGGWLWYTPRYHANQLLREIRAFRPGVTSAEQIEELERRGLVQKNQGLYCNVSDKEKRECYGFIFGNTLLSKLHLAPPSGMVGALLVRQNKLAVIQLTLQYDRLFYGLRDSDCDSCADGASPFSVDRMVNGLDRIPGNVHIQLTRKSSDQERSDAYGVNLDFMTTVRAARDGRDLNSKIWH
jgi:hypothetical protein